MTVPAWRVLNAAFRGIERVYCRFHRLEPVGSLIFIQRQRYRGPAKELVGGVRLEPGVPVAELHFNNSALSREQAARGRSHGGFVFARLLVTALQTLADKVQHDPELQNVAGFHGVTWIPPHGRKVGFEAEPLPLTWRARLRGAYLRVLLYAFNPATARRVGKRLQPYEFWLSREQLLEHFADGRKPR
ncbi:hypothetical protein CAI21_11570 [Alkalilimnicola ehrlichii]|uniref:YkoP-like domain-containing protein n=1 Tax=Alkalilimnicola ehrlichii TaxID=351052 RepID=A0A3E0WRS7_9GAMM|nr:hypothetical protein [Alkalilimnicola ehrlichii]RFA28507.1 hypothetical protein CAI21_11570 [Alkalilimnicola ehrlichii]RFA35672.1 hypothetical protein CAL65_12105 [Alkalilimnicola ehrlichii]